MSRLFIVPFSIRGRLAFIAALALAATLFIPVFGAREVAAGDQGGDVTAEALVDMLADACSSAGGAFTVHYDLDTGGHINNVVTSCSGGNSGPHGWICQIWPDGYYACFFTQPTQTPVESTRPGTGSVIVADPGENPIVTPTVVITTDSTSTPITRPTEPAEPTPAPTAEPERSR